MPKQIKATIQAKGLHITVYSAKWITATNAIGRRSRSGRYGGGIFAHVDIATTKAKKP